MSRNNRIHCTCELAELMRSVVPLPGNEYSKLLLVHIGSGERIGKHEHRQHTVLYYPAGASDIVVKPVEGMIIYLPPGTPHHVPTVKGDRVSVAMLVDA